MTEIWVLLLSLAFLVVVAYLIRVIREDDRGHSFTRRQPPRGDYLFGAEPWTLT